MTWVLVVTILLIPLTGLACSLFARRMKRRSLGQQIRDVGPRSHTGKAGTPTMGGSVVILLWIVATTSLGLGIGWPEHFAFVIASGLGFGAMGLVDDILGIRKSQSTGLTAKQKIVMGSALSIGLFLVFQSDVLVPQHVPFSDYVIAIPRGAGCALAWILLVSSTNSANLTDGLDGLAAGVSCLVLVGLLVMRPSISNAAIILPLIGALAGFLWTNVHPASLFLGDVGAFALGGIIGALALANGVAFLLPMLAGVFVLEAASVVLQIGALRLSGRRAFKMSPLHHHFEAFPNQGGAHWLPAASWPESQVTVRFWLIQAGFVILALWAAGTLG